MTTAADLLKATGLLPDGPVRWGDPVRSGGPGVLIVELNAPISPAPIDVSICGKWAERVTTLQVDGARPDGKQLQRRLAGFWLPSQTILYVTRTEKSIGGRVASLYANQLGSRLPHPGGHWLKTLRGLGEARIWWHETAATQEAEDAILEAFAAGVPPEEAAALHDPSVVLPWATLQTATGQAKATGITGSLLAGEERPVSKVRRSGSIGVAGVGSGTASAAKSRVTRTRAAATRSPGPSTRTTGPAKAPTQEPPRPEAAKLTPDGLRRLKRELDDLRDVQRPANVLRIKTAREHGDLKENAEYQEARREQGFLEGKIQQLEALIRTAVIVEETGGHEVAVGSTVVMEHDGERVEYAIVGSSEAKAAAGRISYLSPIGAALMSRRAGDEVAVRTPSGELRYRIVEVR